MALFEPTKDRDQIREDLKTYLAANTLKLSDFNVGSILRTLVDAVAIELGSLYSDHVNHRKQAYIETAAGEFLDLKVADIGVTRKPAAKATGTLRFSRSTVAPQDFPIPLGTRARTEPDALGQTVTIQTTVAAALLAGQTFVDVASEAVDAGAVGNAAANAVVVLVDSLPGVEAVTNPNAFAGGADAETDVALRDRAIKSLVGLAKATKTAIEAGALSVAGVVSAAVIENDPGPGQIKVYVVDNTGTAPPALITAVFDELDANYRGIGTTLQVLSPDAISVNVTLTVTVAVGNEATTTRNNVKTAVEAHLNGRTMGMDILQALLVSVAMGVVGVENVAISGLQGTATDQVIIESAVGGETSFNLPHGQIVASSDTIKKNTVALVRGTDYTINNTTGEVTLTVALIPNDQITATYTYGPESGVDLVIQATEKPKAGVVTVT